MGRRHAALAAGFLVAAQCVGVSDGRPDDPGQEPREVADTSIIAAQEALTSEVIDLPGVTGTAVGLCDGEPCIKVYLASPSPELVDQIPSTFRGFAVDVEITGEFRARGDTLRD